MEQTVAPQITDKKSELLKKILFGLIIFWLIIFLVIWYITYLQKPPADFPLNKPIEIISGLSVREISHLLQERNVVQSNWLLNFILLTKYNPSDIKASTYIFTEPINTFAVAKRLSSGDFASDLIRFTHIEGERALQIADSANELLANFDKNGFLIEAVPLEGKLFPDTYFIPKNYSAHELLVMMLTNYEKNLEPIREHIKQSPLTENEVIILASIVEREANSPETMKYVSGILQNRLGLGIPLQVDASLEYILDKTLPELKPSDLEIVSPYNTYLNTGLPPTPIGNPGLESIQAVLNPIKSNYLYYITDDLGNFHYASNFEEHKANIAKYLR